jgi:hypothetical protein
MSFFGLTRHSVQPDPMVAPADSKQPGRATARLTDVFNDALDAIRSARPAVAAERREQERSQGLYPQAPPPRHQGSGHNANTPVQPTRPGSSGRVGGPSVTYPRQQNYAPPTTFPKTLD